jgi:hypothetical protein
VVHLVLRYYFVLRSALRSRPHLRPCLTRCRHCRIFFLTHPRNVGRGDLGCPFGCREAHRRKASSERGAAYYRTESGRTKKRALNGRRGGGGDPATAPERQSPAAGPEEMGFDATIVEHVRVVVSLVEGFRVSRGEVLGMLRRTLRQRSILEEGRIDYVLRWLREHPP